MNVLFLPCDFCPSGQNNQIAGQLCPLLISPARDTPNAFGEFQDLNLVFSGSIVFSLRAPVQPVRCAGLGEVAGGPPQRGRTETTPLEPRAICSEYETLFVKQCTKPLCLCRRHYRAKIALHAGIVVSRNPPQSPLLLVKRKDRIRTRAFGSLPYLDDFPIGNRHHED